MKVNSIAFLCGYFSVEKKPWSLPDGWTPVQVLDDKEAFLKNFYFPEFVDFFSREVKGYRMALDRDLSVSVVWEDDSVHPCSFRLEALQLYIMPQELALFSVKLVFDGADLGDMVRLLSMLRSCHPKDPELIEPFTVSAIAPLEEVYARLNGGETTGESAHYPHLVENGNKFKLFQLVQSEELPDDLDLRDRYLYAAGTLVPFDPEKPSKSDPRYFHRIMQESRIGVFTEWTALALLDTLTCLAKPLSAYLEGKWLNEYYGMVYVYELYRKCILYHFNMLFRERMRDPSVLQEELDEFSRHYTFNSLSYNFLPSEIDRCVVKGLAMEKEDTELARFLAREVEVREKESDRRREDFLLFLTILAGFSAVWDIVSLLEQLVDYQTAFCSVHFGYRLFTAILLVIIVAVLLVRRKKKSR